MFKYFLPMIALVVSVAGVGVSLGREEVRCLLGLSSTACDTSGNKSTSPSPLEPLFNQKANQETISPSKDKESQFSTENSQAKTSSGDNSSESSQKDSTITKEEKIPESKLIPVEELSAEKESQPPAISDDSLSSSSEETVGIPIKVEPYQQPSNSQP